MLVSTWSAIDTYFRSVVDSWRWMSPDTIQHTIDAFVAHETADRLQNPVAPTLVLAGGQDIVTPPRYGRAAAETIPIARFEVLPAEAHQPFHEVPEEFNARVDAFWREVRQRILTPAGLSAR